MYSATDDQLITRDQLAMIPTPRALGRFHNPYPFGQYIEDVDHALGLNGIKIINEEFAVTKDHGRMFGVMEIGSAKPLEGELITSDEWSLLVGVRGAHDQKIQRGLVLGSSVMVCSNLCFSGNVGSIKTKQTTNIAARLPGLIRDAVAKIPELAHRQERVYDAYHDKELRPRGGDAALVEIYRRDGMSSAQLGRAIHEWHEPTHGEHEADGWTAWRLMNSVTESLKPTGHTFNQDTMVQRTQVTSKFLDEICHIDF
jgi:hypothetical protein